MVGLNEKCLVVLDYRTGVEKIGPGNIFVFKECGCFNYMGHKINHIHNIRDVMDILFRLALEHEGQTEVFAEKDGKNIPYQHPEDILCADTVQVFNMEKGCLEMHIIDIPIFELII